MVAGPNRCRPRGVPASTRSPGLRASPKRWRSPQSHLRASNSPTSTTNSLGLGFLASSKGPNPHGLIVSRVVRGNFQVAFKCAQLALDRDDEQEIIGRRILK